jgi:hypothetical protein
MAESNIGQNIQDEVLSTIRKSQAAVVDAIERLASSVESLRPELPEMPFADALNVADKLPKPEDMVRSAYDFAEQLLASQRQFAEDVLKATAPLLPKGTGKAAE